MSPWCRYWEEKARDLREEHDDLRDASDAFISSKSRTPVVTLRPDKSSGITYKNREVMRRIRAEREREVGGGGYGLGDIRVLNNCCAIRLYYLYL